MTVTLRLISAPQVRKAKAVSYATAARHYVARNLGFVFLFGLLLLIDFRVPCYWSFSPLLILILLHMHAKGVKRTSAVYETEALEVAKKVFSRRTLSVCIHLILFTVSYYFMYILMPEERKFTDLVRIPKSEQAIGLPAKFQKQYQKSLSFIDLSLLYELPLIFIFPAIYAVLFSLTARDVVPFAKSKPRWAELIKTFAKTTALRTVILVGTLLIAWTLVFLFIESANKSFWRPRFLGFYISRDTSLSIGFFIKLFLIWTGILLKWEAFSVIFTHFFSQEPLRGKELLSSSSPDPNGTLVDGLSLQRSCFGSFLAWEELKLLVTKYDLRRQQLLTDVDTGRVVWKLIYSLHKQLIEECRKHIESFNKPVEENKLDLEPDQGIPAVKLQPTMVPIDGDQNLFIEPFAQPKFGKIAEILTKVPAEVSSAPVQNAGDAKKPGPFLHKITRQLAAQLRDYWKLSLVRFYGSWVGKPFRKTVSRALAIRIGNVQQLRCSLEAMAVLFDKSLTEDDNGYVQLDVGDCLLDLQALSKLLKEMVANPAVDATNVPVLLGQEQPNTSVVEDLQSAVDQCFNKIGNSFKPYFDNLNISKSVQAAFEESSY